MSTPLGPQLIGETEKCLNALLHRFLDETGITEPHWVTLRLADLLDGSVGGDGLVAAVTDRAHFADAASLVNDLTTHGLLNDGRLTSAGRDLISAVQARITAGTAAIWDNLSATDVAAAGRVLNEVVARARVVLGSMAAGASSSSR